jgi:hypothetical protein
MRGKQLFRKSCHTDRVGGRRRKKRRKKMKKKRRKKRKREREEKRKECLRVGFLSCDRRSVGPQCGKG